MRIAAIAVVALAAGPAAASAWNGPIGLDRTGGGEPTVALSCPADTQCTVVDQAGQEVTYDPTHPANAAATTLDPGRVLNAISCPFGTPCTAVDADGRALTFDPANPGSHTTATIDSNALTAIECLSATQCAALDDHGQEITFDPTHPGSPTPAAIDGTTTLTAIACGSLTQCTVVDAQGQELTFDPANPGSPTAHTLDSTANNRLNAVSCVSATLCAAVDSDGNEVTFDPTNPGTPTAQPIDGTHRLNGVSCTTFVVATCMAVDDAGHSIMFNLPTAGTPTVKTIDGTNVMQAVSCGNAVQCTAIDDSGHSVSFNPAVANAPAVIDGTQALAKIVCPAANQCTAVDSLGEAVTFDPTSSAPATTAGVDTFPLRGIDCTRASQCVVVDTHGRAAVFDPTNPGAGTSTITIGGTGGLRTVSCPAQNECVTVDGHGTEFAFDPSNPAATPTSSVIDGAAGLIAVSCPLQTACTAIDGTHEITFNPQSPGSPSPVSIDSRPLRTLTCPASLLCLAGDTSGGIVTFDPTNPGTPAPVTVDPGQPIASIWCAGAIECLAVDGAGQAVDGPPHGAAAAWTINPIAGANSLLAVACPMLSECVTVDSVGNGWVGEMVPLPSTPPTVAGSGRPGQTLTESHAGWFGDVNAYSYQWQLCDAAGAACAAIAGATGQTYVPGAADLGHTVRVSETATNAGGTGAPTVSGPTAITTSGQTGNPTPPSNSVRPSIAGSPIVGRKLSASTGVWTGAGPLVYSYQWQRCKPAACAPIARATSASYRPSAADVGTRLAVVVTATNSRGSGAASSPQTGRVLPGQPILSRVSLTGAGTGALKLKFSLTSGAGAAALKRIAMPVPSGLALIGSRAAIAAGVSVSGAGRHVSVRATRHGIAIGLRSGAKRVTIMVTQALGLTRRLARRIASGRHALIRVSVVVTDGARRTTRLVASVRI